MKLKTQQLKNEEAPGAATPRASDYHQPTTKGDAMNTSTHLITIESAEIDGQLIETVNARELHSFLDVGVRFNDWIFRRINEYGFVDGQDFYSELSKTPNGGRPSKEYAISLDMAKELSMVERNEKGKQARQYFIECERKAKQAPSDPMQALSDPATMRGLLLSYSEKVLELESQVTEQAPKVDAYQRLSDAEGSLCITDAAKYLQVKRKDLINYLYSNGWIYRRVGNKNWLGYDTKRKQQLVTHKATTYTLDDGTEKLSEQVRITPKGLAKLALTFQEDAA